MPLQSIQTVPQGPHYVSFIMLIIGTNLLLWNCKAQCYYITYATILHGALRYMDPASDATGVENDPTPRGH